LIDQQYEPSSPPAMAPEGSLVRIFIDCSPTSLFTVTVTSALRSAVGAAGLSATGLPASPVAVICAA
jgi:hypothetical protein